MPRNPRHRLLLALGPILLIGVGLCLRLLAEPADDSARPTVQAGPVVPLLPEDFPKDDVEMFGHALSSWDEDSTRVIQYKGDFRLDFARRRLFADNAVVWIRGEDVADQTIKHFTVYLEGNVRIRELGGTSLSDTVHLVTFQTVGKLRTFSQAAGNEGRPDNELYGRARRFRQEPQTRPDRTSPTQPAGPEEPALPTAPPIRYEAKRTSVLVRGEERVIIAEGKVYVSQADPAEPRKGKLFMEIQADRGVVFARESKVQQAMTAPGSPDAPKMPEVILGAYLEGAVELRQGERTIKASRLYYDFEHDRALILDAVLFEPHPSRPVPMIVWAEQLRQLSRTETTDPSGKTLTAMEFSARRARITTSEMNTPQYDIRAKDVYLRFTEKPGDVTEFYYKTWSQQFAYLDVPLTWWPGSQGTFDEQPTALRHVRTGVDTDFGLFVDAEWDPYKLLNMKPIPGFDAAVNTAFYGSRGPAVTLESDYRRDNFFGYLIANATLDRGGDELGDKREQEEQEAEKKAEDRYRARGRVLWRHHHYLQKDWQAILEVSWMSDPTFLEEWYEKEYDTGKEQETLVYLKKAWDNNAFTALLKPRINTFLNQAEKLPEVKYYKLGEPLWNDRLVYFTENSAGVLSYAVDDRRENRDSSGMFGRLDTRHEVQLPLRSGPVQIVPYLTGRLTYWGAGSDSILKKDYVPSDDTAEPPVEPASKGGGGDSRLFAALGVNASTMFSRVFNNVESPFWDVHRLRHLVRPRAGIHLAANNVDRYQLLPLDGGVEGIVNSSAINIGLDQRLETKRGGPGAWRNVDWMRLELSATLFFNDATRTFFEPEFTRPPGVRKLSYDDVFARGEFSEYRPENSLARSTFNWLYQWRLSDTTTLMADGNLGEGGLDRANFGVAIQRSPRWRMFLGSRYIAALNSNDVVFQTQYKINRKYDLLFSYGFDTIAGQMASTQVTLVRKLQRIYLALTFDVSNTKDRQMVMISIWPEGAPEIHFGPTYRSDYGSTTSSTKRQ